jgi:hypothetical protein
MRVRTIILIGLGIALLSWSLSQGDQVRKENKELDLRIQQQGIPPCFGEDGDAYYACLYYREHHR